MRKQTKNTISWVSALALLIGLVVLIAATGNNNDKTSPSSYSASSLAALENNFDFDTISMKSGKVSHKFEVRNNGVEPVKIEKVYTSCMCTSALIFDATGRKRGTFGMPGHGLPSRTNIEVAPGESITVEAVFDPSVHGLSGIGLNKRSIYLETNSAKSPKLELSFQAMVTK
jgi:urease beta subunit